MATRCAGLPEPDAAVIQESWDDPEQFAAIFDRYFTEIHQYLARRVGAEAAYDLTSEVFLTAFAQRERYDVARGSARSWLYGIATNMARRYWRREQRLYRALARPAGYQYALMERDRWEACWENPRPGWPGGTAAGTYQLLGAQPATPADAAAWRRDGSPNHWAGSGSAGPVSGQPGRLWVNGPKPGEAPGPLGDFATLPTDPAKLRAILTGNVPGLSQARIEERFSHESYRQIRDTAIFDNALLVLGGAVKPAVRAAAFQLLASLPEVRMKPGVTDPSGQVVTAVWLNFPGGEAQPSLIDPATAYVVANESLFGRWTDGFAAGTVQSYALYHYRWTNRLPTGN